MLAPHPTASPLLRPGPITAAGVLGSPFHGDPLGDAGVLAFRDPSIVSGSVAPLSLREFITEAMPAYGFHRWALVLIALLQQIADG